MGHFGEVRKAVADICGNNVGAPGILWHGIKVAEVSEAAAVCFWEGKISICRVSEARFLSPPHFDKERQIGSA